ncbi:MAG: hypothetical protein IPJ43_05700 [Saprospiraceae bacterium]|nr:hypothetical protein [Saprospiraceae bacterium]
MSSWKKIFALDDHRTDEIKSKAALLNMNYSEKDEYGILNQLKEFKLIKDHGGEIYNVLSNHDPISKHYFFDYKYTVSTGKSSTTFKQSVNFFNCKALSIPEFHLRPEEFYDKFLTWLGFPDINFESHTEFSHKYKLTGEYKDVIKYYFHKDILDLLSSHALFHMEGMNYYLILYHHNYLLPSKMIPSFVHLSTLIYELFKLRSKSSQEEFKLNL